MFAGQCLPMGSDGVGECQGRRTKRGGRTGPSSFQSAALPTELPAAPSLETAGLHSALRPPRYAPRPPTPPLTSAACAVTVSVTVSGATFCWSAVRLRLAKRPVLL